MKDVSKYDKLIKAFQKEFDKKGLDLIKASKTTDIPLDYFPKEIQDKYKDKQLPEIGITHKGSYTLRFYHAIKKERTAMSKEEIKIIAKSFVKAIKKYIDKCNNGYMPPESIGLRKDLHDYVSRKALKYMEKGFKELGMDVFEVSKYLSKCESEEEWTHTFYEAEMSGVFKRKEEDDPETDKDEDEDDLDL